MDLQTDLSALRIYFYYSNSEWRCIENQMANYGYSDLRNFVHHRIRKQLPRLPDCQGEEPCKRELKSFTISDSEIIVKLRAYCHKHKMEASTLVQRIATDPVLRQCLLGPE